MRSDRHTAALRLVRSPGARLAGSALLGATLLLGLTGCGDDGDSGSQSDTAGASEGSTEDAAPSTAGLKVCSLVDFQPLLDAVKGKFSAEPENIERGRGKDPGGEQCPAQLRNEGETTEFMGQVHLSVVPYSTAEAAKDSFKDRIAEISGRPGATTRKVNGAWAQGTQANSGSDGAGISYVVLRDSSVLYKAEITWQNMTVKGGREDVTAADVDPVMRDFAEQLHTKVTSGQGTTAG